MLKRLFFAESPSYDPWYNLAVEEALLPLCGEDGCILYLWQNENTVVIGQNQNAFAECRTGLMEQEGARLARRLSGGGAVYHDLGNLNFTFLMPSGDYDLEKQMNVLLTACHRLGIDARRSGRNDILVEDRKFSGNAFYRGKAYSYHHGTILLRADLEKLSRYLSPSKLKLQAKGVKSVRGRVANLCEFAPGLTVGEMKKALRESFVQVYGLPLTHLPLPEGEAVERLKARNESWDYNYGTKPLCTVQWEARLSQGGLSFHMEVQEGRITQIKVYSDAMEHDLPHEIERCLLTQRFSPKDLAEAAKSLPVPWGEELAEFFRQQEF